MTGQPTPGLTPEQLAKDVIQTVGNDVLVGAEPSVTLFFNNVKTTPTLLNVELQGIALKTNLLASFAMDEPKVITDIATLVQYASTSAINNLVKPVPDLAAAQAATAGTQGSTGSAS